MSRLSRIYSCDLLCLMVKQYTCEATIVPCIALDDGGASTSQQMTNLRRIKVVEYSYMILSLVSPWPSFQFLPCF